MSKFIYKKPKSQAAMGQPFLCYAKKRWRIASLSFLSFKNYLKQYALVGNKSQQTKKSQAAMEFLMTYGWALLVVLLVGVAIFFYVGNPYIFFPDKIDFGQGINVPGFTYSYIEFNNYRLGSFEIYLKNGLDKEIIDATLTIDQCNDSKGKTSHKFNILPDKTYRLLFNCENITTNQGINKFNGTLKFKQKTGQEFLDHSKKAEIIVKPNDMVNFPDDNHGRKMWAIRNGASGENDENRFYPCDGVPGCINPDPAGNLKKIFGGYIDSMTGKVWSQESDTKILDWARRHSAIWDVAYYEWDYDEQKYVRESNEPSSVQDDIIGTAFVYCESLVENTKSGWKLPTKDDFDGLTKCNQCLPPYGEYGINGIGDMKFYWTETPLYGVDNDGQSQCFIFEDDENNPLASCTRWDEYPVRCIRDNP